MNLPTRIEVIERLVLSDHRGEFLKVMSGFENHLHHGFGEIYVTKANPKQSRGGHFHRKAGEWFTLIEGTCLLRLIDPVDQEWLHLQLSADVPRTIFVPPGVAHRFDNDSPDRVFLLLAYSSHKYDPDDTVIHTVFP